MKSKILTILMSAAIALGLWLYVITVEQPESEMTYYNIPVVLQNEDILAERGLMIVSERPTVTLHLSSTRTNLNQLNESNINVIANVNSIVTAGTHELTYNVAYPGNVPSGAVSRQSSRPNMITLKVENRITRQIPVVPVYSGSVAEGLLADRENLVLDNAFIEVSGPESVVEKIAQAAIFVNLEGQTQTIVQECTYTLCDESGEPVDSQWVTTNVEVVNLTLTVRQVKEVRLSVKIVDGGGATALTSSVNVEPKTIRVSGSEALLNGLDVLELGTINLGEIAEDETLTMPITLPEGITNETGITEATVTVHFPNLTTKTMSVDNIELINIPEGLEAELVTKIMEINLRGPKGLIEDITEEQITVKVDLSEAQTGTDKYAVTIEFGSGFAGVGALNSYTVMVTLTEAGAR